MAEALQFILNMLNGLVDLLETPIFVMYGVNVSLWAIMLGGLVMSICITVFWKGARG